MPGAERWTPLCRERTWRRAGEMRAEHFQGELDLEGGFGSAVGVVLRHDEVAEEVGADA
jgi:hypothetical protein